MAGEVSNKTLAVLLVVAIAVSVIGLFSITSKIKVAGITGMAANDTGVANLTVSEVTAINFTDALIDWGTGKINASIAGANNCTMDTKNDTDNPATCVDFNEIDEGFYLENTGDTCAEIQLASDNNATDMFGATTPAPILQYAMVEGYQADHSLTGDTADACTGTLNPDGVFTDVNKTAPGTMVCTELNFADSKDELEVDLKVMYGKIGVSTGTERKSTYTATATKVTCTA